MDKYRDPLTPFGVVLDLVNELRREFPDTAKVDRHERRLRTLAPERGVMFVTHSDGVNGYVIGISRDDRVTIQHAVKSVDLPAYFPSEEGTPAAYACVVVDGEVG